MSAEEPEGRLFETSSGTPLERRYGPEHLSGEETGNALGEPGAPPYTRGIYPDMYRGRLWTMRQYAGYSTARESNARYRYLLEQGTTGLSVAFDLPTQMGYDSDHELARGEVGKSGVAIDTISDMETLFRDIPLDQVSTSMTINATAIILLAFYAVIARRSGIPLASLSGTIQNDILKEYFARGTYIYPPGPSMRLITDIFSFCASEMPRWNTISISGYHIREAGASAVQEIAFTFANAIAYLEAARTAGLDLNIVCRRVSFFFNAHNNLLEEVAKFRAARRLWTSIARDRFGVSDPEGWRLRFHTQTAGSTLTAQQPANNIVRVTLQALASILGGTQSLHTNSMDEALALPTEEAVTIALRTQQIIAYESGSADTVDPLAGSYAIESLTDDLEEHARSYLSEVDELGGAVGAIEAGYFQREIHRSAYAYQQSVENGERSVVGVNRFQQDDDEQATSAILHVDPLQEAEQVTGLQRFRDDRDAARMKQALDNVRQKAETSENMVPVVMEAVDAGSTLGEISDALRDVWGTYQPPGGLT
ncbi:methylmalonyl-CoA mutase [Candidatus Zixiibacteriota bacterium]